jgi:uncharacterized protein YlxP (DUF503 family)
MRDYLPAPDEHIVVGVLRVVLHVPGSRSLKDRRRVVSSLKDRLIARHKASVAEVGHLQAHDRAVLAVTIVGNDAQAVQSRLDQLRQDIVNVADALVVDAQTHTWTLRPGA